MNTKSKLIAATMVIGIGALGFSSIGQAQGYDGINSGEIEISGSIGKLNNTDPGVNLPEGSDDWINVMVDTATAFHTTTASHHANIESANYNIKNNSGRGVAVYLDNMTGPITHVKELAINPDDSKKALGSTPTAFNLITNGAFSEKLVTPWLVLANKDGELKLGAGQNFGNSVEFNFTGKTQNLPSDVATRVTPENYKLTLKFAAVQADGVTIGE